MLLIRGGGGLFQLVDFMAERIVFTAKFLKLLLLLAYRANQSLFFDAQKRITVQCTKIVDNFYAPGKFLDSSSTPLN